MHATAQVLVSSALAGAGTLVGTFLVLWKGEWMRRWSLVAIALAAGAMATTALAHLIPEAIATHPPSAPYWTLAGFGLFFLLNQIVSFHACGRGLSHLHPIGTMALVGILVHSFFDGVAIGSAFGRTDTAGQIVATAVFLHELPEGAITVVILLHTGMTKRAAVLWGVVVGLATPIGAAVTLPLSHDVEPATVAALLGLSGGSFLYVAATNLLPETNREGHRKNALAFVAGVVVILGLARATLGAHAHAHPHPHPHPHPHAAPARGDPGPRGE